MVRFSLGCYTMRVQNRITQDYLPLNDLAGGQDLFDIFSQYCRDRQATTSIDNQTQKLIKINRFYPRLRSVCGIVETGEFGYEADIFNVQLNNVAYQRTVNDAEMMPYYLLTNFPAQRTVGVLMLQRRSQFGISTVFARDFMQYFEDTCPEERVLLNYLVPQQLIDQYMENGELTKVRFIRHTIPSDIADFYDAGGPVEENGHIELTVVAGRGWRIPLKNQIRNVLGGSRNVREMVELQNFKYDNVKVELDVAGSRRTLDLSNIMNGEGTLRYYRGIGDRARRAPNF